MDLNHASGGAFLNPLLGGNRMNEITGEGELSKFGELQGKLTDVKTKSEYLQVAPLLGESLKMGQITQEQHSALLKLCVSLHAALNEG